MPWIVRKLLPESAMILDEESWNCYPYCKTVLTALNVSDEILKQREVVVLDIYDDTHLNQKTALNVSDEILKQREVVVLDIYDDTYLNKKTDIRPETDPSLFLSQKTGRGPLAPDWSKTTKPVMCCYKLVTAYFKWTGFQGKIENFIHGSYPRLFTKFHRELWSWVDLWYDLTLEDIHKYEEETAEKLRKQRENGKVRGMSADGCIVNPLFEDKENFVD
uniref:Phosphatidylinositol transfer protein n=1 Tax=Panagrolaimus sp. PS1159 TaxID=55785 RepID=A0AC35GWB3_9BILA